MNAHTPNTWAKRSDDEMIMVRLMVPDHISSISYQGASIAIPDDRVIEVPDFVHHELTSLGNFTVAAGAATRQPRRPG